MTICSILERPTTRFEKNSGERLVEGGYIPAKVQIEQMIQFGRRLEAQKEQFDFRPGEEIDEKAYVPTREPNFDLADATRLARGVEKDLSEQREAAIQRIADQKVALQAEERRVSSELEQLGEKSPKS